MDQSFIKTDNDSMHNHHQNNNNSMNVRFVQQVKIRIGEAKNLQPKHGTSTLKDCFCVIRLDREEIFRTHNSNDKTSHPFFGEEFYFDIPRVFRYLSIYLYERERTVNNSHRNRPLGKVSIRRDQLKNFDSEESWFPLVPVHHSPEVQGVIHLQVEPQYILNTNTLRISISIYECQELAPHNCDSFICLTLKIFNETFQKKSKVKRKTINPQFNESFNFEVSLDKYSNMANSNSQLILDNILNNAQLRLSVHESCSRTKNNCLGQIRIPLNKLQVNSTHNAWYYLQPQLLPPPLSSSSSNRSSSSSSSNCCDYNLGSLRLRINYISDYVHSSPYYDSLRNLLLSSTEVKPITSSVAYLLGEFMLNKADAAQPLVKIFLHYKKIVPLIKYLAEDEISKVSDVNTIFRGNSLVSKCIDELMKLVGIRYLHDTLKDCVDIVINESKICEIDPTKIKDKEFLQTNMNNLKNYTALFFNAIVSSVTRCPQVMCDVFSALKELAIKFFPGNKEVCYYVISGFVFLRFFAPSILNPRLFELTDKKINFQVNRTFTLISKTIQSIGNLVVSKKNTPLIKENYMMSFYKEFITEFHVSKTKEFLESISSSCRLSITKDVQEPVILKESIMLKKSNGYKRIGFGASYKKRYFCITTQHFFYAKAKNKTPLFKLPINEISVKKSADNYPMKNMFQVIHNKCTLHIQASNCVQEREWLDTLNRLIQLNQIANQTTNKMVQSFSNDNANNNKCHQTSPPSPIAQQPQQQQPYQQSLLFDLSIKLDPDREMARIHSLFVSNLENIQTIIDYPPSPSDKTGHQPVKIWKGNSRNFPSHFFIEDRVTLIPMLSALKDCICHLEKSHKQYLSSIIGSEQAPFES